MYHLYIHEQISMKVKLCDSRDVNEIHNSYANLFTWRQPETTMGGTGCPFHAASGCLICNIGSARWVHVRYSDQRLGI